MLQIFAVYDKSVQAFMTPFFVRARGEAIRGFMDECMEVKSPFNRHSTDFALYYIGLYDPNNGSLSSATEPERVITAAELVSGNLRAVS